MAVLNERLHQGMQFKTISEGGLRRKFQKCTVKVKNRRGSDKIK